MTSLAIGVVSYEGSRFSVSQGDLGLARQLADRLADRGIPIDVRVNTTDAGELLGVQATPAAVQASLTAQLHLDRTWARYLGRPMGVRWWAAHAARWARRAQQRLHPPGEGMVTRLLDIEASHLDLLAWGVAQGAEWILILEDDAMAADLEDCADGLAGLLRQGSGARAFINLSRSFGTAQLGIDHLLAPLPEVTWEGTASRQVLAADRPVTNTVCAILYRSSFAWELLEAMHALPLEPVVPIDWKLNLALMAMVDRGALGPGACWLVEPAPIEQMSMRG